MQLLFVPSHSGLFLPSFWTFVRLPVICITLVICALTCSCTALASDFSTLCCDVQEIKFEPSVMCEPLDKKLTFKGSQVRLKHRGNA